MNPPLSNFSTWANDPARTVDERYTVWLLCEAAYRVWYSRLPPEAWRQVPRREIDFVTRGALKYNPALAPTYGEGQTDLVAEMGPWMTAFEPKVCAHNERPIRDAGALRFFPALESVKLGDTEMVDLSWVEVLPNLRTLWLNSAEVSDLSPMASATGLRELRLQLSYRGQPSMAPPLLWPDAGSLGALTELEILHYGPNAAVLEGLAFPRLGEAHLSCVGQRDCHCLPAMPALRVLTLSGVESLRGISRFPVLRNLEISGPLRDLGEVGELPALTSLKVATDHGWPRIVEPLAAARELRYASFTGEMPRNYWPLAAAPKLRELDAPKAVGIEGDVQVINAALSSWDLDFLAPESCPLPPLRFLLAKKPHLQRPPADEVHPDRDLDPEMFRQEILWMERRVRAALGDLVGHSHGLQKSSGGHEHDTQRRLHVIIQTQDLAMRLPEAIDVMRRCMAESPHEWWFNFWIHLRIPEEYFDEQQKVWMEVIRQHRANRDDDIDYERHQRTRRHLIETTYLKRSAEEEGEVIDPSECAPGPDVGPETSGDLVAARTRSSKGEPGEGGDDFELRPYDEQDHNDDDDDDEEGGTAVEIDPNPPESFWEDPNAHPLADSYCVMGHLSIDTFCVDERFAPTAMSLMRREAIPVEEG
jgi:hypothetical protein